MKKRQYSKESLDKAILFVKNEEGSIRQAAKQYGVPRTTIIFKLANLATKFRSGPDTILTPQEEQTIVDYIISLSNRGFPRKKDDILDSVQSFLKENPRSNPFKNGRPGEKWISSFMKRHPNLTTRTAEGVTKVSACVSESDIRKWFSEIGSYFLEYKLTDVIKDPTRIYNADETCFHICPKTGKVVSEKGAKNVYVIEKASPKENITVMFAFSASGRTCAPMIIYPNKRIPERIAETVPAGWGIGRSENGWMTAPVFYEYVVNVFYPDLVAAKVQFSVILYVDGHKTHLTKEVSDLCKSLDIHLIALYPNATRILQPADVASFKPIKSAWKKHLRLWYAENNTGEVLNKQNFASLLKKVVDLSTNESIAQNGFRTTGLFPFNPDAINYEKCLRSNGRVRSLEDTLIYRADTDKHISLEEFTSVVGKDRIILFENACKNNTNFDNEDTTILFRLWKLYLDNTDTIETIPESHPAVDTEEKTHYLDEFTGELLPKTKPQLSLCENRVSINYDEPQPSTSYSVVPNKTDCNMESRTSTPKLEVNNKITILANEPLSVYLHRKNMWPASPKRKGKRQSERLPYALTSDTYLKIMQEKEDKKKQCEQEKENKKIEKKKET